MDFLTYLSLFLQSLFSPLYFGYIRDIHSLIIRCKYLFIDIISFIYFYNRITFQIGIFFKLLCLMLNLSLMSSIRTRGSLSLLDSMFNMRKIFLLTEVSISSLLASDYRLFCAWIFSGRNPDHKRIFF